MLSEHSAKFIEFPEEKIDNTGAYTRYTYPTGGLSLNAYETLIDANGDNVINGSDEVLTETFSTAPGRFV